MKSKFRMLRDAARRVVKRNWFSCVVIREQTGSLATAYRLFQGFEDVGEFTRAVSDCDDTQKIRILMLLFAAEASKTGDL